MEDSQANPVTLQAVAFFTTSQDRQHSEKSVPVFSNSDPTIAIYNAGSHNLNSADKFSTAADPPAVVEHCDDGELSPATSPHSAVSKVLGILR